MKPSDYWKSNSKLEHITPPGERFPEIGLYGALQSAVKGSVFEFGCGDGRLAPAFNHQLYTGYDINEYAIKAAKQNNPGYTFGTDIVDADTVLAYTVLLHIPDDEIQSVMDSFKSYQRIVIGEVLGRQWRRPGNPPVFNRNLEDYIMLAERTSYSVIKVPCPRYNCDVDLIILI